ncbi:hypothetical protein H7J83_24695 [Mycobacterium mantenii]|nr:hypothetical protein [Mycobacterium mantenii]MCV7245881.1 hypothetical protein [Mycobacterium mantenii]
MTEQPDRAAYNTTGVLETRCPDCGAAPYAWCVDGCGVRRIPCVGRLAAAVRALRGGSRDHPDLKSAIDDWRERRARGDVIEPGPPKPAADVAALACTATTVTHLTADGPFTEHVTVARAIMPKTQEGEQK